MMSFNAAGAAGFNPLLAAQATAAATTNPTTPLKAEEDPLRNFLANGNPLFGQFPFPAAMAQAMAQAQSLPAGYPVMFPAGIPQEFKPEMLAMAGGPYPSLLMDRGVPGFHPYGLEGRRKNATRETTAPLKQWLNEHRKNPYPTKAEKVVLAVVTHMSLTQVSTWFANARRRLKKENKMTWSPQNRRGDEEDDDDLADLDRPSSSNSAASDRKDELDVSTNLKLETSSPTPSGESSEGLTPKKKIWSIADVASGKNDSEGSSRKENEDIMNQQAAQQMLQQHMMMMARMQPQMMAAMRQASTNPGVFNPFALFGLNPAAFQATSLTEVPTAESTDVSPTSTKEASKSPSPPSDATKEESDS